MNFTFKHVTMKTFGTMKIAAVSAISVMGAIIFSMIPIVGAMPSYRKDSYSKENTYEKAKRFDKYSSLTNDGNGGYSGNRGRPGSKIQERYSGNSFQGGYIPVGYSGYSGFGGYPKMTKDALVPRYPTYIPDPFIAKERNTDEGPGVTLGILLAVAFLILLLKSGVFFENEDSLLGIINNQRIDGSFGGNAVNMQKPRENAR